MECNFRSDTFSFNSVWRGVTLLVCVATNCNDIALKTVSAMQIQDREKWFPNKALGQFKRIYVIANNHTQRGGGVQPYSML